MACLTAAGVEAGALRSDVNKAAVATASISTRFFTVYRDSQLKNMTY